MRVRLGENEKVSNGPNKKKKKKKQGKGRDISSTLAKPRAASTRIHPQV